MRGSIAFTLMLVSAFVLAGCLGTEDDPGDDEPYDGEEQPTAEPTNGTSEPDQLVFEYGPSLGCVGDFAVCISAQLGPDQPAIDGFWQELDESYWGLSFIVTTSLEPYEDTDCTAYDENQEPIEADLNNGAGPCEGALPKDTKWLFLYSYAAPAPSLELEFSA